MVGFRVLTITLLLLVRSVLAGSAVQEIEINTSGDPDLLPVVLKEKHIHDDESRRPVVLDHIQVYRAARQAGDTAVTVQALNSIYDRDNPAIFRYYDQTARRVIDEDPVIATVSHFTFYIDRAAGQKGIVAGAFRNDSAFVIRLMPGRNTCDFLYLSTGSDHSGNGQWEPKAHVLLVSDYDFDGHDEAFVYVNPVRDLEPRELFCIDAQDLKVEWSLPVASVIIPGNIHDCRDSTNPGVIFVTTNVKNGVADRFFDDRYSYLSRVNSKGVPVYRYIVSEEHEGAGIWPAEREGTFYLLHSVPPTLPEDSLDLPSCDFSLSRIEAGGSIEKTVALSCGLADTWISGYGDDNNPALYTLSTTGRVLIYDTSLALLAKSGESRLKRMVASFPIEGQSRPVFLFTTGSGLELFGHDFSRLGHFPERGGPVHPLTFNEQGRVVQFIALHRDRDYIIEIDSRPLLEYGRILFWKYQNTILIILTLLALALVLVNAFRQRAVRKLRDSVTRFREMADLLPQGVFEFGLDSAITFANHEALRMFGFTPEDLEAGILVPEVVAPEDWDRLRERTEAVLRGEETGGVEYTAVRRDGSKFPMLTYSAPVWRGGQIGGVRGIVMDISERRRTEEALKESETKFRSLVENVPDIIFTVDASGRVLSVHGQPHASEGAPVVGDDIYTGVAPEHREALECAVANVFKTGHPESLEVRATTSGRKGAAWYQARIVPIIEEEQVRSLEFISTDITERIEAQAALRDSEEKYRSLVESAGEAIFAVDRNGVYKFVNSIAARRLGLTPDDVIGRPMTDIFPPDIAERQTNSVREVFDTGEGRTIESVTPIEGKNRWYRTSLQPVLDAAGQIVAVLGVARDITEVVETQRALGTERDFVRSMLDTSNSLVICLDKYACITVFNRECERVTGYKREEVTGKYWPDLFVPKENHRHTRENFADWVRAHPADAFEDPIITRDGEIRTILWSNSAMFHPNSDELTAIAVGQDITDRKRAEQKLQESERKYRSLVEHSLQAIFIIQGDEVVLANRRLGELLGADHDNLEGVSMSDILSFVEDESVRRHLRERHEELLSGEISEAQLELRVRTGQGDVIWTEAMVHRMIYEGESAVMVVLIDVNHRKEAEQRMQALNQEKYEQAQRIAGGFAHEIRNALFPAEGALYRLIGSGRRPNVDSEADLRRYSSAAAAAVSRAIDITELISYSTGLDSGHDPEPVNLQKLIGEILKANEFAIEDQGVEVTTVGLEGQVVESNHQQLYLAFNNLLLNSLDALTETVQPAIFIEATKESGFVRVIFGDNGCGILPDDLDRVFDTFFSSKPDKGTGLGLAMSRQILEMYGGSVSVESASGEWTRFEIKLRKTEADMNTRS